MINSVITAAIMSGANNNCSIIRILKRLFRKLRIMDLEYFFLLKDLDIDYDSLPLAEGEDKDLMQRYIELTRLIQQVEQLFLLFIFNVDLFVQNYEIYPNGLIVRVGREIIRITLNLDKENKYILWDGIEEWNDYIAINAFTNNVLSSGRNLIEILDYGSSFFNAISGDDSAVDFKKKYLSHIYDNSFAYRFLYEMRNYTQHTHLAVSLSDHERYCFDLNTIMRTPRYDMKSDVKAILSSIAEKIHEETDNYPFISVALTLAEYTCCVTHLSFQFIKEHEGLFLKEHRNLLKSFAEKGLIHSSKDEFDGHAFYCDSEEGVLHAILCSENQELYYKSVKERFEQRYLLEKEGASDIGLDLSFLDA